MNRRKKYLISFILSIIFWLGDVYLVFFTEPENKTIFLFLLLSFLAIFLTLSFIFLNKKLGFLSSLTAVVLLFFKILGILNLASGIITIALTITVWLLIRNKK